MNKKSNPLFLPLIASLTLGLAPFYPKPHIYKQYLNIANGTFTEPIAWLDLALHGFPWLWLLVSIIWYFTKKTKGSHQSSETQNQTIK